LVFLSSQGKNSMNVLSKVRLTIGIALFSLSCSVSALVFDDDASQQNPDSDGNGICDGTVAVPANDSFKGCMPNMNSDPEADSDGDLLVDIQELLRDSDGDKIPDYLDFDDGAVTSIFGDVDTDGINDQEECGPELPCRDTDNNVIYDFLDLDSDNDGLTDDEEADGIANNGADATVVPQDTDGDGLPDYRDLDSDNDGMKDADERDSPHNSANPKDSDNDGIPDYVDVDDRGDVTGGGDSDGDGITDEEECPNYPTNCPDSDGDGQRDYLDNNGNNNDDDNKDTDNDGIPDSAECGTLPCVDTDGDGIPDFKDKDSDGDGVSDADECNSWPNCSDTDGDGIVDYLDVDSPFEAVVTDAGDAGSITTGVQGAGSLHLGFALVLSLLVMLRRKSALLMVLPILFGSLNATAQWSDEMALYLGAGIGQSYLDPSLSGSSFSIDDDTQNAWKLTAGWDLNDHISVEGYYSDLGSAELNPDGEIDYRMMGGNAILHFWAYGDEREKGSIALYAKAGVNHMTNNGRGVNYDQDNTIQLMGGVGAEYYLPRQFSVRFEFESYDTDASLLSLNLVKRFGFESEKTVPKAIPPKAIVLAPIVIDSDLDGLLDDQDQCPNTPKGTPVDEVGCAKIDEKMSDLITKLQFENNSALLTVPSKIALDEIADLLARYPDVKIEVQAHSDSNGSARYNKTLSQQRANSVVQYLIAKDIMQSRLESEGFGEEKPIADNNTKIGRAKNRRVEFVLNNTK
jgi:outer membrane protein OmpA-like peptidoglycan-associated protein